MYKYILKLKAKKTKIFYWEHFYVSFTLQGMKRVEGDKAPRALNNILKERDRGGKRNRKREREKKKNREREKNRQKERNRERE